MCKSGLGRSAASVGLAASRSAGALSRAGGAFAPQGRIGCGVGWLGSPQTGSSHLLSPRRSTPSPAPTA
jgi:hypothetical protein